jgi:hypothetical protein
LIAAAHFPASTTEELRLLFFCLQPPIWCVSATKCRRPTKGRTTVFALRERLDGLSGGRPEPDDFVLPDDAGTARGVFDYFNLPKIRSISEPVELPGYFSLASEAVNLALSW